MPSKDVLKVEKIALSFKNIGILLVSIWTYLYCNCILFRERPREFKA